jgi:hypothetical protein
MKERTSRKPTTNRAEEVAITSTPADNGQYIEWALQRDKKFAAVCRSIAAAYVLIALALAGWYALQKNWYLSAQSLGTIAVLAAMAALVKLLKIQPVYSLYALVMTFTFAAYTLGVACAMYQWLPGYDKLLHTLSGTMTMMMALPLFYTVKHNHRVEKEDCALAAVFCLMTALAVAGVWEIAEYAASMVLPTDPQCVAATGVSDTMIDMIVCSIGALAAVPSLIRYYKTGEGGLLYTPLEVFLARNLRSAER